MRGWNLIFAFVKDFWNVDEHSSCEREFRIRVQKEGHEYWIESVSWKIFVSLILWSKYQISSNNWILICEKCRFIWFFILDVDIFLFMYTELLFDIRIMNSGIDFQQLLFRCNTEKSTNKRRMRNWENLSMEIRIVITLPRVWCSRAGNEFIIILRRIVNKKCRSKCAIFLESTSSIVCTKTLKR